MKRVTRAVLLLRQFTQTDPRPLGAGSAFESSYVYVGNNPVVYVDPSGLRKARAGAATSNPIRANSPAPEWLSVRFGSEGQIRLFRERLRSCPLEHQRFGGFESLADTGSAGIGDIDGILTAWSSKG